MCSVIFQKSRLRDNVQLGENAAKLTDMDEKVIDSASLASLGKHHPPTSNPLSGNLARASSDAAKEAAEYAAKYRIYERDFLRRLNHKYFAGKNLAGTGRVFETVTAVDGFTVKESRSRKNGLALMQRKVKVKPRKKACRCAMEVALCEEY